MRRPSSHCDWCGATLTGTGSEEQPEADRHLCDECQAAYVADTTMREIRHNEDFPE